jgi:alkylation response protein AidB-like acyl-CoA dehydrogenase
VTTTVGGQTTLAGSAADRPRLADYFLSPEQDSLREGFATFFERECPPTRVRAAERTGFDPELWEHLCRLRAAAMGVPESAGGDGAGLLELLLVVEEAGRRAAPVPLIEAIVAGRLLAETSSGLSDWLPGLTAGTKVVTLALRPNGGKQLAPSGSVADAVVFLDEDRLMLAENHHPARVATHSYGAVSWFDPELVGSPASLLVEGPPAGALFAKAMAEWKLLTAANVVGMASASLSIGVEHARSRTAFGTPIGSFQAVSHALANVAMATNTARRLIHKAAWFLDHEPGSKPVLVPMAYLYAAESAVAAATTGVHVLGGVGFTTESDQQLFFRRIKGSTLILGDPSEQLLEIADLMFGPPEDARAVDT